MKQLKRLVVLLLLACVTVIQAQETTPAPYPTVQALYLTMRDGVQIAVDVYLPDDLTENQQIPTLIRATRYWRAIQNLDVADFSSEAPAFLEAGYALVMVDARGSGASEGTRTIEWSPDEVADYGEVVEWIIQQPWSNGRVGGYGVSYEGNTAELLTVPNHPAVKAVAPLFSDFDPFSGLAMPGGVFNRGFIEQWAASNDALDRDDICFLLTMAQPDTDCAVMRLFVPGVKSVDDDPDRSRLKQIVAERENYDLLGLLEQVEYRDDSVGGNNEILQEVSPYGLRDQIESSGVPMFVRVGWLDAATADGAISRYQTFSNPQHLIIGPYSHGGGYNTDPFMTDDTAPEPSIEEQYGQLIAFFDYYLKDEGEVPTSEITYYTLNAETWTTTDVFPPTGFEPQVWYFGEENTLSTDTPTSDSGADEYTVDYTATTGDATRWHTQLGGSDVIYPDRAAEDEKLLVYTSDPLTEDTEITGTPVITLYVASTTEDAAFHVYLEDVAPDGRVNYITEGILRGLHRQVETEALPYETLGVYHSLKREDSAPLVPGEVTEISFNLYTTSVLIEEGHSIRVAIAGHDASMFERYPAEATPTFTVEYNRVYASSILLPVMQK